MCFFFHTSACMVLFTNLRLQVAIDSATPVDDAGPSSNFMMSSVDSFGGYGGPMRTYGRMYSMGDYDDVSIHINNFMIELLNRLQSFVLMKYFCFISVFCVINVKCNCLHVQVFLASEQCSKALGYWISSACSELSYGVCFCSGAMELAV